MSRIVRCEQGLYLVLTAFLCIALLAVAGLAVDAGKLYVSKLAVQKAADTAAIGGLSFRTLVGWERIHGDPDSVPMDQIPGINDSLVLERARQIAFENLRLSGMSPGLSLDDPGVDAVVNVDYNSVDDQIRVRVVHRAPLLLIDLVPLHMLGVGDTVRWYDVDGFARAVLSPANIGLVLDVSGSMGCPRKGVLPPGADPCACRFQTPNCALQYPGELKINKLQTAVDRFLEHFNPNRDRVSFVPFNIVAAKQPAEGFVSVRDPASASPTPLPFGQRRTELLTALANLDPASNTNICDGLHQAFEDLAPAVAGEDLFLLLFSDGAPNSGRFRYDSGSGVVTGSEWYNYKLDWYAGNRLDHEGPSQLVNVDCSDLSLGWTPDIEAPATGVPGCPALPPGEGVCGTPGTDACTSGMQCRPLSCLGDTAFRTPVLNRRVSSSPGPAFFNGWRENYYHCAVAAADEFRRSARTTVFAVGLGPEAPAGSDPYQTLTDDHIRKDFFLRRVSFDHYHAAEVGADPEVSFAGYAPYAALTNPSHPDAINPDRQTDYYATEEADDLPGLFSQIAKSILLRLVE